MSLKLNTGAINKVYLGSSEKKKIYLGSTLVFDNTSQPPPTLTYQGTYTHTTGELVTNVSIGAADVNRLVFLVGNITALQTVSGCNINGSQATTLALRESDTGAGDTGIVVAKVPTGTTCTFEWLCNDSYGCGTHVFTAIAQESAADVLANCISATDGNASALSVTLNSVPAGAEILIGAMCQNGSTSDISSADETVIIDTPTVDYNSTEFGSIGRVTNAAGGNVTFTANYGVSTSSISAMAILLTAP